MALPYENATSGQKALDDIRKVLTSFGCSKFGTMSDLELQQVMVQFEYRGRQVSIKASARGYAAAWLKEHPFNFGRTKGSRADYEKRALAIGNIAVYSILRDWIKGQITAVETGMLTFEGAFLGQILLSSGKTVLEEVEQREMLPAPAEEKILRLETK